MLLWRLTDFIKSLIIEIVSAIIISAAALVIAPYVPSLIEMKISLSMLIVVVTIVALVVSAIHTLRIRKTRRRISHDFYCANCNRYFGALPPDDLYDIGTFKPFIGSIPREYTCDYCYHVNTIYWVSRILLKLSTRK